ncbi:MAG: transglutaminase TgpA family protein [Planctomycetota bacterium]
MSTGTEARTLRGALRPEPPPPARRTVPGWSARELHRVLRHLCVLGLLLSGFTAAKGFLPELYTRGLAPVGPLQEVPWPYPVLVLGMSLSWLLRKQRSRLRGRLLLLASAGQAGGWVWLTTQDRLDLLPAVCGAWAGTAILQSFGASSQQAYRYLQALACVLLILGGWRQTTELYPQLVGLSVVLLVLSVVCGRASPAGVAAVYVDTGRPSLPTTVGRALGFLLLAGVLAWPLAGLLPRPTSDQREFVRQLAAMTAGAYDTGKVASPARATPAAASIGPRGGTQRVVLSRMDPPAPQGVTLFAVQGPKATYWRQVVLARYDGASWRVDEDAETTRVRILGHEQLAILRREDGALLRMSGPTQRYQVHVLADIGTYLPRPLHTGRLRIADRLLTRDGRGNVEAWPPLRPPLTYEVDCIVGNLPRAEREGEYTEPIWLSLPPLPERLAGLARRIRDEHSTERAAVGAMMDLLRSRCEYALIPSPVPPGRDATDHFLFVGRHGWCTHFASALAVLCRSVGIPARVVLGYGGGAYSPLVGTYGIRDSDAHAWVEACPDNAGWTTFDPTPPGISPLQGAPEFLPGTGAAAEDVARTVQEAQGAVARSVGWMERTAERWPWLPLLLLPIGGAIYWVWRRRATRHVRERIESLWSQVRGGTPRAAARAAYALAAGVLERYGYGEEAYTSPAEYVLRLRAERHPAGDAMQRIVSMYEATAFGPRGVHGWDRTTLAEACEVVLHRVGRGRWLPWRVRSWRRAVAKEPYAER